jgi:hypothetical protein
MAHGGARCAHASERRRLLKPARGGVRRFAADRSELRLNMGSHDAATCRSGGPMASGGGVRRRVGTCRVAPTPGLLASHTGENKARCMDQQTRAGLGMRGWRAGPGENRGGHAWRARRHRAASARERHAPVKISSSSVHERFSPNFSTEVVQGFYTKVVHHTTLYNFAKSSRVLFSTVCAQCACQVANFLGADEY